MPTSNVNDEMRQSAEYAIRMAKERFGQDLEYSESSLSKLEILIEQAYQQFGSRKLVGKVSNDTAVNHTAIVWGSYLGEIIRGKWGGAWIIGKESNRLMVINDIYFSPIYYIYQRITGQLQDDVKQYFDEVVIKLSSQPISFVQPALNLPSRPFTSNQSQIESSKAIVQPQNISNNKSSSIERVLQIVLGVVLVFLFVGVASWFYSSQISGPASAKATQQAVDTQQAAFIIATAMQRAYRTPTTMPSKLPTQIQHTPTPTENINCKTADVQAYFGKIKDITEEDNSNNDAMQMVGITEVLKSPAMSSQMAEYTRELYDRMNSITPPGCAKNVHYYLSTYFYDEYNAFREAAKGNYQASLDWSKKSTDAIDQWHIEMQVFNGYYMPTP